MAVLMLWSNSTTVSLGQSFFLMSSRVTISPTLLDQHQQDFELLLLQHCALAVLMQLSGPRVELEVAKAHPALQDRLHCVACGNARNRTTALDRRPSTLIRGRGLNDLTGLFPNYP